MGSIWGTESYKGIGRREVPSSQMGVVNLGMGTSWISYREGFRPSRLVVGYPDPCPIDIKRNNGTA